jgi:hypothetical protein
MKQTEKITRICRVELQLTRVEEMAPQDGVIFVRLWGHYKGVYKMFRAMLLGLVAAGALCLASSIAAQDNEKGDKLDLEAKKVAEDYMNGVWKQKIEDVMKLVDVPFYWDGKENIKDRERLKSNIERLLKRDRSQTRFKSKAVYAFAKLPKEALRDEQWALLKKVLDETDRVVIFELSTSDDMPFIMIRIREGKMKVVGFDG